MLRTIGTILLAIGFLMLAGAWAITDPLAIDANIGAGDLILIGRPAGALGPLLLVIDVARRFWQQRASRLAARTDNRV